MIHHQTEWVPRMKMHKSNAFKKEKEKEKEIDYQKIHNQAVLPFTKTTLVMWARGPHVNGPL